MKRSPTGFSASLLVAGLVLAGVAPVGAAPEVIVMRSGNGLLGQPDAAISFLGLGTCCFEFPNAFTPADFTAAANGPPAIIIGQAHPNWSAHLTCDSQAQWVGTALGGVPQTALYSIPFVVHTSCISSATLDLCWIVDDILGGLTTNLAGVYVNGNPVPISGGNYATDTVAGPVAIGGMVTTGLNYLYLYGDDIGAAVSGVNFHAVVTVYECPTPVQPSSWSSIKTFYR